MYTQIEDYIKLSRDQRRSHLNLIDPCIEIGGKNSKEFRGLLAHYLKTTIPSGKKIVLCHACNNSICSNVSHLYWGTAKDNTFDQIERGTYDSIASRSILKYGEAKHKELMSNAGRLGGISGGGKNKLSDQEIQRIKTIIDSIPIGRGRLTKLSNLLLVSHTQVRRYLNQLY